MQLAMKSVLVSEPAISALMSLKIAKELYKSRNGTVGRRQEKIDGIGRSYSFRNGDKSGDKKQRCALKP